jgi:hypothetical protein
MRELLNFPLFQSQASPTEMLLRLLAAAIFGLLVALLYRRTHGRDSGPELPTTLILLAILIATVTQVIGDSVARAFSLAGALSIVRFRTVVRDTRDTAFVIFAVVLGMAAGAAQFGLALLGFAVAATAALLLSLRPLAAPTTEVFHLRLRASSAFDATAALAPYRARLLSVELTRQATLRESVYRLHLEASHAPAILQQLANTDGVQEIRLHQPDESD